MLDIVSALPQRVLIAAPATLSAGWYVDGALGDPGDVTATITRADGSVLVEDVAAAGSGVDERTLSLDAGQLAELADLTVTWQSDDLGELTTHAHVVGGFMFTVNGARALKPLDNTVSYPLESILAARTLAEMALEETCAVAFVPRFHRETLGGKGTTKLFTGQPLPRRVISATIAGTALNAGELAELQVDPARGFIWRPAGWPAGERNVVIEYEHGHPSPPANGPRAALLLAKRYLVDSPVNDRATTLINQDGTTQFLVTAGVKGAVFDLPEVNAFVSGFQTSDLFVA